MGNHQMVSRTLDFLLLGVAILRADVLPRWAGLLLIIGVLLAFGSGVLPLIRGARDGPSNRHPLASFDSDSDTQPLPKADRGFWAKIQIRWGRLARCQKRFHLFI